MTQVLFFLNTDHKIIGFECDGHSGYAKFGKDIVCAGISVLTINTINSLEELANAELSVQTNEKSGFISCKLISLPDEHTEILFRSLEIGIKGISEDYGSKYCKVNYKED